MHRRFLKPKVMAALFSAAFLLGAVEAGAYTYSGVNHSLNELQTDETNLTVTTKSNIKLTNSTSPQYYTKGQTFSGVVSGSVTIVVATEAESMPYNDSEKYPHIKFEKTNWGITVSAGATKSEIDYANNCLWSEFTFRYNDDGSFSVLDADNEEVTESCTGQNRGGYGLVYNHTIVKYNGSNAVLTYYDASVTVSDNSALDISGDIKTSKSIDVKNTSILKSSGAITGGTITADRDIVANTSFADSAAIRAKSISATTTLKADGAVQALNGGTISAKTINAGTSVQSNTITAGGNVKGASLNVGYINASSTTITGNQNVSGTYGLTNQAKLNGGVSLNGKKITGLVKGTLSATSTDLVNGAQLYDVKGKISSTGGLSAGSDVAISSANAISVDKAGKVAVNNTGIVTGNTVYTVTGTIQSSLDGVTSSVSKNSTTITSLQDGMADLKKSIANINSTVASTTKNLSSSLSNRLQADLGNLSDDGKSVIKNLIAETLRSMNISTAAIASTDVASLNTASISSVSIMPTTVDVASMVISKPVAISVTSADVDSVYNMLNNKVDKTDFDTVKAGVDSNASAIAVNAEGVKANTAAIDTLQTSKTNADGSNLDIDAYTKKLGTGAAEKDNTGLVNGGAVYGALDKKADVSYVDAGLGVMSNRLDSVEQTVKRDMNRMGANAAALASLHPQDYDSADKFDFAAGYGHFHDSNATAVGAFYRPNASTMVSLAGTVGNGDSMVSAGLSFKLGMNDKVEKVMISKDTFNKQQVENKQMKGHLDNQTARLQQMEAALSAMISR